MMISKFGTANKLTLSSQFQKNDIRRRSMILPKCLHQHSNSTRIHLLHKQQQADASASFSNHNNKWTVAAAAGACDHEKEEDVHHHLQQDNLVLKTSSFVKTCWKFIRPHAVLGNLIIFISVLTRSWLIEKRNLLGWFLLPKVLYGLWSLVAFSGYTTGINQIFDLDIDRINKPELPMASGELSVKNGWLLVIFYAVSGILTVVTKGSGPFMTFVYCLGLFIATTYSAPPIRFKRLCFGIPTMVIIAFVRGFAFPSMVAYAASVGLRLPFQWTVPLAFLVSKASVYVFVISFLKDLSDVDGDTKYGMSTLPMKFGVRNIALLGSGILLTNFIAGISAASYMHYAFNLPVIILTQFIFASSLIFQAWMLHKEKYTKEACETFYQFIWKLMNVEFLVYPFI